MIKEKLNYKVKENVELGTLIDYGFCKTMPEINPWWQCSLTIDWSKGIGVIKESLYINKHTREVFLNICEGYKSTKYKELLKHMLNSNILVEI